MNPLTESATNSSAALSKNTALSGYAKDQPFVLSNLQLASCSASPAMPDNEAWSDYGLIEAAAIAIEDGKIAWCGAAAELPSHYKELPVENCGGRLATPSLIDCHTHIVHGGSRAREFEQRLGGVSYSEISASGGGIVSTVNATRSCSVDELVELALPRIDTLLNEGVCVLEIKSGYGLDQNTELNMLRAARKIETLRPVTVKTSFLGAHALPAEFKGSNYQGREQDAADTYIDTICLPALEQAHTENLVDAVDGFCEHIAFSVAQIERVFKKAQDLNLPVKLHAEQLSLLGGTELAARFQALSADHLEYLDEAGVKAMAESSTVAVLLPGAFYTLREKSLPPLEHFRQHKVPIAIATDSNPGSSPLTSLLLAMNMSCTLFSMTPAEALNGVTRNAARALGLKEYGSIEQGKCADLCLWDVQAPAELSYRIGFNPLHKRLYPITPSSTIEAQS